VHEYSIVQALVEQVETAAAARGASAVHRVRVSIGALAGIDPELLRTAYDLFRVRTICERAPLDITEVPARWVCRLCGGPIAATATLTCAACGGPGRLAAGDEILLDQVELEVA
jgi:hydrogenase nickel incorporation protein HypA/HybF